MPTYTKNVSEPWFSLMKLGAKKCEGRLNKGDFSNMEKGDYLVFHNTDFGYDRTFRCRITSVHIYPSFELYLMNETLDKCLPGVDSIAEGVRIYYKYYTPEDEHRYGVRAIRIKLTK